MFLKLESWKKACIFEEASIFEGVLEVEDLEESLDLQRSFNLRRLGRKLGSSKELQSSKVFLKLETWKKACIFKGASIFEDGRLQELRRLLSLGRILSGPSGVKNFPPPQMKRTPLFIEFPAGNEKIRIADDSLVPISGKGQIVLFDNFSLQNVLHVPKLSYNLLSISKITCELHCNATFLPESICFQDLSSGRTIGTTRHSMELYILDDDTSSCSISRTSTSDHDFMLWHFRLGHPNFTYIKYLFPHLFPKIDVSSLSFEVCIREKQHQTPLECLKESYPSTRLVSKVLLCMFECTAYVYNFGPNQAKFIPRAQACVFVGHLEGESVSEESNSTFEFIEPIPSIVSDIDPHPIILPTNQVSWKTTETSNNEAEQGHTEKIDKYDPSLDLLIALRKEMKALEKNNTWEICTLPKGQKPVACKWVFTLKYKIDGTLDRHKARVLLSVAVNKDWPLYQRDVKNDFLNGDLVEEVYKSPAPGFQVQFGKIAVQIVYVDDIVLSGDDQTEISQLNQFMQAPYEEHMEAIKRILRYLKMIPGKGLMFRKTDRKTIEAYTDSDWTRSVVDRKSTSGYCTFVWGNLVTWRSKKKSVEAEYRAMSLGICEEIWLQKVQYDLHQEYETTLKLFCDNIAIISIANNPVQHDRTKHVEID
ncbi:putative mitochondrial protein [Cucumis melo var. makuwa]|uniref:Mitochondrial protein n=1 Tax=Cucumis melo var. makuwa TaxID=1194695 RepID=A0A5A7VNE8_CUCMM|nr:putative mitochondrial protein [Cucumis melo var. makuwa]